MTRSRERTLSWDEWCRRGFPKKQRGSEEHLHVYEILEDGSKICFECDHRVDKMDVARQNPVEIRDAVEGDIPWLLTELAEFAEFADTEYSMMPDDEDVRKEILSKLIQNHLFLVAHRGEVRVGFAAGAQSYHIFNPSILVFHELFWWVSKDHRGSSAGLRLLDAVVQRCADDGVDWVFWDIQHNTPVTDRVLKKRGFREQERKFLLEL